MAAVVNPLSKIAKPKAPAKSGSTKKIASVTDEIKGQVDIVIQTKAAIAELEARLAEAEEAIRAHVRPQQDKDGFNGDYSKTYIVEGNTGNITVVTSDKYSVVLTEEDVKALQSQIGEKSFDQLIRLLTTVTILPEAAENAELMAKVCKAVESMGLDISQVFKVETKYATVKGTDERVYVILNAKTLEVFRTYARQNKASIR